jgi:hypothetical protein
MAGAFDCVSLPDRVPTITGAAGGIGSVAAKFLRE